MDSSLRHIVANIIAYALIFISSCCNPFIYYISSRNFRKSPSRYSLFLVSKNIFFYELIEFFQHRNDGELTTKADLLSDNLVPCLWKTFTHDWKLVTVAFQTEGCTPSLHISYRIFLVFICLVTNDLEHTLKAMSHNDCTQCTVNPKNTKMIILLHNPVDFDQIRNILPGMFAAKWCKCIYTTWWSLGRQRYT